MFRPILWGAAGYAALNLLLFGDLFFAPGSPVLSSPHADLFLQFGAWRQFAFDQLGQGHLPLWNPHYLGGTPFLGNFQSALLYPPNWFGLFLPLAWALNLGIVLHVFLAGFLTFLWALRRGLHPLAAFLAGTVFMYGGAFFLHLHAGHLTHLCAMAWAPAIFLSLEELFKKWSWRWAWTGAGAVSLQILAGHPQYVYFTALLAGVYVLLNLRGNRRKKDALLGFGFSYGAAVLLTAAQLWTGLQAFSEGGRLMPMEYRSAASFHFPPQNLLTLFLPDFFGSLEGSPYWSQWYLWEVSIFIGVTAVLLALLTVLRVEPDRRRWALTMAVAAVILAFGAATPLHRFLYDHVPLFDGMRGVCKFAFLASLFLALLAGMGLDSLIREPLRSRRFGWASVHGGLFLAALGVVIWMSLGGRILADHWMRWFGDLPWLKRTLSEWGGEWGVKLPEIQDYIFRAGTQAAASLWIGGATFALAGVLLWLREREKRAVWLLAGLVILESFLFARRNRPTFDLAEWERGITALQGFKAQVPGDYRVYGTGCHALPSGHLDIWADEPMILGRYGRFLCATQGVPEDRLFSVMPLVRDVGPIFRMLRLGYRIHPGEDPIRIQPMPFRPLPRMLLVGDWEKADGEREVLARVLAPGFDPEKKVILEEAPVPVPGPPGGKLSWRDLSTDRVEIQAELRRPSLLLVTDNFAEGWRVRPLVVDPPQAYRVIRGNSIFRVIPLAAGRHHFFLEYRPWAFTAGLWVSLLSIGGVIGILLHHFRRRWMTGTGGRR